MLKLIKWLFILLIFGLIGLAGYAYLGPYFGADFSAPTHDIAQEVQIDAQ